MDCKGIIFIAALAVSGCSGIFFGGDWEATYRTILQSFSQLAVNLQGETPRALPPYNKQYDFIIVGSGSAGSVIANRLSEIPQWRILLLEAGHPEGPLSKFPLLAPLLQFTDYNWGYTLEPQRNFCRAMIDQRCAWPRGRALGGSSVINYMIYNRGKPQDYDHWAALGNPGWSYDDVLPYFLKSEDAHPDLNLDPQYHHQGGYLSIGDPFQSDITTTFLEAGVELGYRLVDYNRREGLGFSRIQATMKLGRRNSVAKAFLRPVMSRKNLHVVTGARVLKITLDSLTKKAQGVEYVRGGRRYSVLASKEVIVSAGAFSSPQLLMLSGIGPKGHLQELGIPPLINLPVGETMYDHISYVGLIFITNTTVEPVGNVFNPTQLLKWYVTGVGPLASLGGFEALGYIKTNVSDDLGDYPDVEILLSGAGAIHTDYGLVNRKTTRVSDEFYYKMYSSVEGTPGFTIIPMLLHPKSKGYMRLKSSNPLDQPLFYGNFLSDPQGHDLRTLVAAIRFIVRLCQSEAFKKYDTRLHTKPLVGCENLPFDSDEYWECALSFLTTTLHHQVGTCKMGPSGDPTSVVNHELKVHGVGSLRVADTSVIPVPLSGHTNAPSIMVGEKAADLIKKDWYQN